MMIHSSPGVRARYYDFPISGFASGCNLHDVINSLDPFYGLDMNESVGLNSYSVKVKLVYIIVFLSLIRSTHLCNILAFLLVTPTVSKDVT